MITSMRRCVASNDLWPWPISSRLLGLDLENRVLSVASTVLDGFFPYVVQMITSMRRCVACDDLWPWPISSRSFGLDLENRVLSVASTVLDGFLPYLVQMISSMRRCVACDDLWHWPISSRSFDLDFENRVRSVTFSVLDRLFFWLGIQYDSIMWVIMRRRGVSSERRRSSYSSCHNGIHTIYLHTCFINELHICIIDPYPIPFYIYWVIYYWCNRTCQPLRAPSHYLNQSWLNVKWTAKKKLFFFFKCICFHSQYSTDWYIQHVFSCKFSLPLWTGWRHSNWTTGLIEI